MNLNSKLGLIFFLALKGFRQHMFGSLVAAFSIALAGGLLLGTLKIQKQTNFISITQAVDLMQYWVRGVQAPARSECIVPP